MSTVTHKTIAGTLDGNGLRIAVVVSRFNDLITERLLSGALDAFVRHGVDADAITVVWVPGSFEIPATARRLGTSSMFDAILTLGAVIRGETPHFDAVAGQVAAGVARISIELDIPVIFGVLTTDTTDQAMQRAGIKSGNKGYEVAVSAIEMANLFRHLNS